MNGVCTCWCSPTARSCGSFATDTAATVLHEEGFDHAHIELQLAHAPRNAVSAAYNHATYLPQRAAMMQWWGDYLERATRGNVVQLKAAA